MPRFLGVITVLTYFCSGSANANSDGRMSSLCDSAAHIAAQEFDIPVDVLLAITRTETGRSVRREFVPWPWTVNMEGTGHWFSSRREAQKFTIDHYQGGASSFDLGCFQINYRWHGRFFDSIEDMFEPLLNARYAAQFLTQLYSDFGSWSAAAGAFHSRTPSKAKTYVARFDEIRLNVNILQAKMTPRTASPLGIFDRRGILSESTVSPCPLASGDSPRLGSLFPYNRTSADTERLIDIQNQDS